MSVVGQPDPWRPAFLRFAVDRSILVRAGREYRFLHLLVRDHLAECDPAALGDAVERRRVELVTG
jgi:hypothetical protein